MKALGLWFVLCFVLAESSLCLSPNYGKFWHVTDFHYDHTYLTSRLSCNAQVEHLPAMGDYWCDSPWTLVTETLDAMATYPEEVDFVLWTGDTVAHISNKDLSETLNMDLVQNLSLAILQRFPNTPVYPAFGNHDYYPTSQFPSITNTIYNRTAHIWRDWLGEEEQMRNFRKGGYYTKLLGQQQQQQQQHQQQQQQQQQHQGRVRMVVLNTNLYYTSDKATPGIPDPTGQFQWLKTVLASARRNHEKVILAAHIAPGVNTPRGVLWYQEEFVGPFNKILKDFSDVITAMHFGHDHYDGFKVFYDHQGSPAIPLFVAPSVTPWRFKLPTGEVGPAHNPAIRLVTYDRHTGHHVNIEQFSLDLPAHSQRERANFTLLYSFTEHYRVHDVSATSLDKLIARMKSSTEGDKLLNDYFRFSSAGAHTGETCDPDCQRKIVCGFQHYTRADYHRCVHSEDVTTGVDIVIG